ncbi:hypothetical protein BGX27_000354 [Mortierella sp. AM989]|nr:hypothetical protein BGX27_000354 [Mortierella sp. AM989]
MYYEPKGTQLLEPEKMKALLSFLIPKEHAQVNLQVSSLVFNATFLAFQIETVFTAHGPSVTRAGLLTYLRCEIMGDPNEAFTNFNASNQVMRLGPSFTRAQFPQVAEPKAKELTSYVQASIEKTIKDMNWSPVAAYDEQLEALKVRMAIEQRGQEAALNLINIDADIVVEADADTGTGAGVDADTSFSVVSISPSDVGMLNTGETPINKCELAYIFLPTSIMDSLPPEFLRLMQQGMANNNDQASANSSAGSSPWSDPSSFFDNISLPRPSSFPTPNEVRKEARERVTNIFKDWTLLNHIVQRYEATIQKRWLKKTREQRKNILLTAWPNMSASHRPDMEAFFREKARGTTAFREAYLWPHINQEDLLKPKLLLIFLNARARNFPSAFSAADRESFRFATTSGKVTAAFLNEYTMMFTGRNTPETYGQLYSWDDQDEAASWLFSQRGVHPGYGLQILEVQERVYHFLLECCLQILHEKPRESLMIDNNPIESEPPALSITEGGVNSLAVIAAMAPYRLPASIDLAHLQGLVAAKQSAMEDHIWSLREDPSYFADTVLDMKEHRQELLPDTKGRQHSLMRPYPSKQFWDRVAGNVVAEAYSYLDIWSDLHSQISKVISLKQRYESTIKYEDDLPKDLLEAFLELEFSLSHYVKGPIQSLKTIVVASPPLRASFVRMPEEGNSSIIRVVQKPGSTWDRTQSRLMWLFQTLWDDQQRHLSGLIPLLDEMERLVQNDPKARNLFSSRVTSMIADLSLISECKRQISLYQPWASTFEDEAAARQDELAAKYVQRTSRIQELDIAFKQISLADADPSDGKFFYPVEKRRTKENTELMQQAERTLDKFWEKLDKFILQKIDVSRQGALTQLLSDNRILHRTPDWVQPDPTLPPTDRQKENRVEELVKPLSQLYFDIEHRTQSTVELREKTPQKTKAKTRGVALTTPSLIEPSHPVGAQHSVDIQPTFNVDKRALKVFSTLFYKPSSSDQPGEIPWNDFLHAMGATGFAMEKLYGSVWHFTPSKLDVQCSIQFHEPHPIAKIPFRTARRIGRRLFRAYGWHGDMFKQENAS